MLVPGCMWQTMHWLVGIELVNVCEIGWPDSFFGIIGSVVLRAAVVASRGVLLRVDARAIVGVDDVAGGAAAGAVVARLIVGAEQVERRIQQPRLLQADEHRIGAVERAEAAIAETAGGTARFLVGIGHADLERPAAAALEDAQDVAGLRQLPAEQRLEERQDAVTILSRARSALDRRSLCPARPARV